MTTDQGAQEPAFRGAGQGDHVPRNLGRVTDINRGCSC